jgi:hypothetical protein
VCGNPARTDLCGGRSEMGVPTANTTQTACKLPKRITNRRKAVPCRATWGSMTPERVGVRSLNASAKPRNYRKVTVVSGSGLHGR